MNVAVSRMEVSRIEQIEERQKWQQAYQSLALSLEDRKNGPDSSHNIHPENEIKESPCRQLKATDDSKSDDVFAQVSHFLVFTERRS